MLEYAVQVLKVKHIIVCGHYRCGGVKAAMTNNDYNQVLNMWLGHIKDIYKHHYDEVNGKSEVEARTNLFIELTVREQVLNLAKTSIIQKAWKDRNSPHLHGWVYSLGDGLIKQVFELPPSSDINSIYEFDKF